VKPGDHPDFFKLPPPPGRSRESSIVLDEQGRFWHEGRIVSHPGMARAFASWVGRHPDDGRYILHNGYDWTYFEVRDAPFFVVGLTVDTDGWPLLELGDGEQERLDPGGARCGPDAALYVRVKQGQFEAKFTQPAQLMLAPLLAEVDSGGVALRIGGRLYPVELGETRGLAGNDGAPRG
jgi:hypothetical protein